MRDKSSYFWSFHSLLLLFACLAITSCEDENTLTSLQLSEANVPLQGMSAGVPDVIMDITAQGFSTTGSWTTSNWQGGGLTKYGDNYLQDGNSGKGSKSATFTANVAPGNYNVYSWWCPSPSKATNTPVEVFTTSGKQTLTLDQRNQGGEWVLLGNYSFGSTAKVVIKNDNTNGYVLVDGLKLEATSLSSSTWLEAECSSVIGSNWNKVNSTSASGGTYITIKPGLNSSNTPPTGAADIASFKFNVNQTGSYYLFARIKALDTRSNSFWVRVDGGSWFSWNANPTNSAFDWRHVSSDSNPFTFTTTGNHTVDFSYREDGTLLDKLYLSSGSNAPTGMGEPANNCDQNPNSQYDLPSALAPMQLLRGYEFEDNIGRNVNVAQDGIKVHHLAREGGKVESINGGTKGTVGAYHFKILNDGDTYSGSGKFYRQELEPRDLPSPYFKNGRQAKWGQEYVYQIRMKLTSNYQIGKEIVSFMGAKNDYFSSRNGTAMKTSGDHYRYEMHFDTQSGGLEDGQTDGPYAPWRRKHFASDAQELVPGVDFNSKTFMGSGYQKITNDIGKWVVWTWHVKWSYENNNNGFLRIYKDNQLFMSYNGPNTFKDEVDRAPYFKFGPYNNYWKNPVNNSGTTVQEFYVDYCRIYVPE